MHKVTAVLGAATGINYFLYVAQAIFNFDYNLMVIVAAGFTIIIIMVLLLLTKKVYRLCRECLSTD